MDKCYQRKMISTQSQLRLFIFSLLALFCFPSTVFADNTNQLLPATTTPRLTLSASEQAWLADHPTITLGSGIYPPLNFTDNQGQSIGIGPDYLRLVAQRLGININMVSGDWTEIQVQAKDHKLDGHPLLLKSPERQKHYDFAGPYMQLQYAILVNQETQDINNLEDLATIRVGTMAGAYSQGFLTKNHPEIDLVLYETYAEAVHALVNREVQAVVGSLPVVAYFIDKQLIAGLKVAGLPQSMAKDLYAAVRKDWPQFTAILNKAFASITEQEHKKIRRRWIGLSTPKNKNAPLPFTLKQKAWLAEQHEIKVRVTDLPPYMIIRAGYPPEGIAIDYLNLIAQRTGIKINYQETQQPFNEFLESMKQGGDIDLAALIVNRPERQAYMSFSKRFIESPTVIFARHGSDFIGDIQGLSGKLVAVLKASNVQILLSVQYPDLKLASYDSGELALEALAQGKVDAYIGNLTYSAYIIQKHGFSNLNVVAPSSLGNDYFSMGNRKDWPELTSIINLALDTISEKEKTAIRSKYVAMKYEVQGSSFKEVLMWVSIVTGLAFIIVIFFITWNRSLRKLVARRTEDLQHEITERKQVNDALVTSQIESQKAQKIARLGHWKWHIASGKLTWSDEVYKIYGIPKGSELTYDIIMQNVPLEDHQAIEENTTRWLQTRAGGKYEHGVIRGDGSLGYVCAIAEVECNEKDEVVYLFGTMQDVTERKETEQTLMTNQQRLKSLALQLALVEEQERRSIAADLHDNVGQSLALTRLQLATVLKRLPDDHKAADLVRDSSQSILTALQETRHLIFEISSPTLNEIGLVAAINEWKVTSCEQNADLSIEVIDRLKKDIINLDLRAILFRNIKELVVNAIKHANATLIIVTLEEKLGNYMITIQDNGTGFNVAEQAGNVSLEGGFGLFSIQERMIDLGGEVLITSKLDEGSTIVMKLPTSKMDILLNAK
jgi:ABC-type amino acid transport substrate-binding protein/signal transduction histidine kinase